MKRYLILVIISGLWLLLAFAPGKGEQVQQGQDVQSAGIYKEALFPKSGCFWEANLKNFFEMRG